MGEGDGERNRPPLLLGLAIANSLDKLEGESDLYGNYVRRV